MSKAGDFRVPLTAIESVRDEKVVLNCGKLERRLRCGIGPPHEAEDPSI